MKHREIKTEGGKWPMALTVGAVGLALIVGGLVWATLALEAVCDEQCRVENVSEQVTISTGKLIKEGAIREVFGLREGVNLAQVDFAAKREEVLRRFPAIRSLAITRHLPDRVEITVTERVPAVRMNLLRQRGDTGKVADPEGVVFNCRRGVQLLPVVREAGMGTPVGKRLEGRAAAALRLAEALRSPAFASLGLLEIDTSPRDHLLVTLASGTKVKIAWEGMDAGEGTDREAMVARLANLQNAVKTRLRGDVRMWDATIPDRIFTISEGAL